MIAIKSSPENFSKELSEADRKNISEAVNILAGVADEMMVIIGKRYQTEDGSPKSKTTACIFCTDVFKLSVIERLIKEIKEEMQKGEVKGD